MCLKKCPHAPVIITLITMIIAFTGVSFIINLSSPFYTAAFPFCIVVTILGVFYKIIPNDGVWKGSALMTLIVGLHDAVIVANTNGLISFRIEAVERLYAAIPLSEYGFAWIIPAILGGIVGGIIFKAKGLESLPVES